MQDQASLFDFARACELRDLGIAQASSYPADNYTAQAREVAARIAWQYGRVTADDIWREFPPPANISRAAMGPIFRDKRFQLIGIEPSKRPERRAGTNKVYCLRGEIDANSNLWREKTQSARQDAQKTG